MNPREAAPNPDVVVIGLGYIGLPTAVLLADSGLKVLGVDSNEQIVDSVNNARVPFEEPGLAGVLESVTRAGNFLAATAPVSAGVYIICVPTPLNQNKQVDLTYVREAVESVGTHVSKGSLVILESTVPPGTTDSVSKQLDDMRPDLDATTDLFIAHCPERVLPGRIIEEMRGNTRVIGGVNEASTAAASAIYKKAFRCEIVETDAKTAELSKLAENSFRDVNIAFANELSLIAAEFQVDVWELIATANLHPRVQILNPGPGVGGHCIAVDPWFIIDRKSVV